MQFTTIIAAAFSACLVAAIPTESYLPDAGGDGSMDNTCGNQQKAACCNGENQSGSGSGLVGSLLGGVLGGSCALSVIGGTCSQGSVACCPTTNVGSQSLISLSSICIPITL